MGTWLALATTLGLWASAFVGIWVVLHDYSPRELVLLRHRVASVALAFYVIVFRLPMPNGWNWLPISIGGIVGLGAFWVA